MERITAAGVMIDTVNVPEFAEKAKDAWKEFETQFGKRLLRESNSRTAVIRACGGWLQSAARRAHVGGGSWSFLFG